MDEIERKTMQDIKEFIEQNAKLRQPDVIKSVCDKCGGTDEYCTNCGTKVKAD